MLSKILYCSKCICETLFSESPAHLSQGGLLQGYIAWIYGGCNRL